MLFVEVLAKICHIVRKGLNIAIKEFGVFYPC